MSYRTPPELLRAALVNGNIGSNPVAGKTQNAWPIFVDHLPDEPDNVICIYSTPGLREGRLMRTGETIRKPGWQIRVRGRDYTEAWTKVHDIETLLDGIYRLSVNIEGESFVIQSVTQTGNALNLGQEPDAGRRNNVTINGTITL